MNLLRSWDQVVRERRHFLTSSVDWTGTIVVIWSSTGFPQKNIKTEIGIPIGIIPLVLYFRVIIWFHIRRCLPMWSWHWPFPGSGRKNGKRERSRLWKKLVLESSCIKDRARCQADRCRGWQSLVRWSTIRISCLPMSRPERWIRRPACRLWNF